MLGELELRKIMMEGMEWVFIYATDPQKSLNLVSDYMELNMVSDSLAFPCVGM